MGSIEALVFMVCVYCQKTVPVKPESVEAREHFTGCGEYSFVCDACGLPNNDHVPSETLDAFRAAGIVVRNYSDPHSVEVTIEEAAMRFFDKVRSLVERNPVAVPSWYVADHALDLMTSAQKAGNHRLYEITAGMLGQLTKYPVCAASLLEQSIMPAIGEAVAQP